MAEYKTGSMDIEAQEKTFEGFVSFVTKAVMVIVALLILLAIVGG
jgi:membrane protein required for beta-lactamase induction